MSPLGELGEEVVYFLIDLALPAKHIAVEVDGRSHRYLVDKDEQRDRWLERNGWTVLRFSDEKVLTSIELVLSQIQTHDVAVVAIEGVKQHPVL